MNNATSRKSVPNNHTRSFRRGFRILVLAACGAFVILNSAAAATLPIGFAESSFASGLSSPTAMEFAPDGRMFVCQQAGQLRVIKNGVLLAAPFLTVTVDGNGERGLLGIAFDPNFETNHFVYIYYTATTPAIHNRVSRFTANGDTAVGGSEVVLLDLNNLSADANHNGGAIHFGSDGKLYIAAGENGTPSNAQTLANLLGKILRLNADGTIPTDNPFYNTASGVNRAIWALGLRNPFTFSVQPGTGRLFINDVGESTWEEINDAVAGANFGWPNCEGNCSPANPTNRNPLFQYLHGTGYAIAGGAFYNPATAQFPPTYAGVYFFADYASGWIRKLDPANSNQVSSFATGINSPVDLKIGADGRLYYLARGSGAVYAIHYTGSGVPQITQQPVDQSVQVGQPATFTVTSVGTLSHQWQRNGLSVSGATAGSYTLPSAAASDNGAPFRCVLANVSGAITSNPAYLFVSSNSPPSGTITSPPNGNFYTAGDTIQFAGTASDPEDGNLPASVFSWTIVFCHDAHTHPFLGPLNGVTNGSFTIPIQGETAANVWYRINLAVTDSGGKSQTSFSDVRPRTATMTLTTIPPGLQVTLDGQPLATPVLVTNVVGMSRTAGAISPQTFGGIAYGFASWSDGGAATHVIISPAADTNYTASYQVDQSPAANNDNYNVAAGATLNVSEPGVLGNDVDPNGLPLTTVLVSTTAHGSLNLNANGSFIFAPAVGYSGPDSFTYRANNGTADSGVAMVNLTVNAVPPSDFVVQWGRFEAAFTNTITHADPYRDVTLNVIYTRPDASTVSFWGFYDGGDIWRIRFMPDQIGTWSYIASFSDGALGGAGSFRCVSGSLPGPISKDTLNPRWFGFSGGEHVLIRSFQVGDCFFAANWPAASRTAFLDWAQSQGYNMLSVASHYLNRNVSGRGAGWNTPDLWDGPTRRLIPAQYQLLESMLNDLANRRMLVFPFAGFFGKSSDFPVDRADQELYLRYTLARVGPYWNLLFNVAGPEPLLSTETALYQNAMSASDIARLGNLIVALDPFYHLLTEHFTPFDNAFSQQPWESYTTLQGPKTTSRVTLSASLVGAHGLKPLYAQEALWPGNNVGHPLYTDTDIRKNGFVIMMSAAALNFGDMNGNSSSGFSGSMNLADRIQSRHDLIKRVWDFFETLPFYRMSPRQDLVNNGYCLAEPGREYLVYLTARGSVNVTVSNGPFQVEWINAQNTQDRRSAGTTASGSNLASPADGDDWLVRLTKSGGSTNSPPTISAIPNQTTTMNNATAPIPFTIGDAETPAGSLVLSRSTSNPTLALTNNIVFGGSGANRTVTITPANNQTGTVNITLTVRDGTNSTATSFILTVGMPITGPLSFTNATAISIPNMGVATPYPSVIIVSGVGGTVSNVTLTLRNLTHTWTRDIDVLLVGPAGQTVVVMSDAGSGGANNVTMTLSDAATSSLPSTPLASATYKPANYTDSSAGGDNYPNPAPVGPYGATLSAFNGQSANGAWALYVYDDGSGDLGSFLGGWSLTLTTVAMGGPAENPPTISDIPNQATTVNLATAAIPFRIGDVDSPLASLTLVGDSSNTALVPTANIAFGGSGSNRTVTVTPDTGLTGVVTITVSVSDGQFTARTNFLVTVSAVNDPPTISLIANQTIDVNGTTGPLSFTVGDADTAVGSLTLSGGSSNPALVPTNNIVFGGSGSSRTVTINSAVGLTGSATITVSVGDGTNSTAMSFTLTVSVLITSTQSFTNATAITIPNKGPATPYPSTIYVSGLAGTISSVTLTLRNLSHTGTRDIDVLLVGPAGQRVVVMSDAGSGGANNVTITLSDAATLSLPLTSLAPGTYKPANYTDASSGGDNYANPAPVGPYGAALSAFNGQSANGTWALYVVDDGPGGRGSFAGGWILTVTASGLSIAAFPLPPRITSVAFDATGTIHLTVSGEVGLRYALEASSDWVNWTEVDFGDNTTGTVVLSEQPATNSSRFYRVVSTPY